MPSNIEYRPLEGRKFPRFSGIKTFFRLPHVDIDQDYDVGLLGVPYDGAASYRPGSRFAPSKLRESSSLGRGYNWARDVNFIDKIKAADIGDCPTVPIDQKKCYKKIEDHFTQLMKKNKKFIAVGGDHSITLPILRSLHKKHGKLSLIHFDAHLDTYPAAWDCEYHHGSFARHLIEEKLIDPKKSLQIGIRGPLAGGGDVNVSKKAGLHAITIDDIREKSLSNVIKALPNFKDLPTYITFDIDCLDPVYAPGTGTPVVGGMTTYEAQRILRALKTPNLVGCDIVEICPAYDHAELTTLAGTDVMFEMLCLFAANVKNGSK